VTAAIMSILPAHIMRSVGGKFDNECVAMAAICSTFWLWLRSVRTPFSWPFGVFAGLSYGYMVAAWGGYIFVLNMIGVHALMLVGLGRFNTGVHKAYSLFFVIGTAIAIQIPVVGMQPFRSLEQLGPLGVFLGYQVLAYFDAQRRRRKMETEEFVRFRVKVFACFAFVLLAVIVLLAPTGYFGPLSVRIRGLFYKHTKTGNPLVDSVAEHQPASAGIYQNYLNLPLDYAVLGGLVCLWNRTSGVYFVYLYGFIASHFSGKMSRLVLICAPIVSVICGIWVGFILDFILEPFLLLLGKRPCPELVTAAAASGGHVPNSSPPTSGQKKKKGADTKEAPLPKKGKANGHANGAEAWSPSEWDEDCRQGGAAHLKRIIKGNAWHAVPPELQEQYTNFRNQYDRSIGVLFARAALSVVLFVCIVFASGTTAKIQTFISHCDNVARGMSNAKVMYKVRQRDGKELIIDDYWQGYKWMEKNTPKDSRVMAWWDYGYQITGIANRTSIADGNTWNHEHIATLGRILTSPQKKAHNAIRHLADYVMVWAGEGGDDLSKSPHLARIGNSVFPDHCGDDDPRCSKFGFYDGNRNTPTPMMKKSLLFHLCMHNLQANVRAHPTLFEEVHTTKHGLLRVFKVLNVSQESKDWVADPKNRICDAPGSWYCVGQYPPPLNSLIAKRQSFSQVEDFNKQGEKSAYTKLIEKERSGGKSEF